MLSPYNVIALSHITRENLLVTAILPAGIVGMIFLILDVFRQMSGTSSRIMEISNFTATVAKGDYSKDKLLVRSRDEFGILIGELNSFYQYINCHVKSITPLSLKN